MAPDTGTALILLVAFVLPGFVTLLIQERTFTDARDPTPLDRLLRILYYSVWSYLLLAAVALIVGIDRAEVESLYDRHKDAPANLVWRAALVVIVPSMLIATTTRAWSGSVAQRRVLSWLRVNAQHTEPTGWDFFFRQGRSAYVRATVTGGGRVFGFYGSSSFAAYTKDGGDLYLERMYAPGDRDWFGAEPVGSCGVWIRGDDLVVVEFYDPQDATEKTASSEAGEGAGDSRP